MVGKIYVTSWFNIKTTNIHGTKRSKPVGQQNFIPFSGFPQSRALPRAFYYSYYIIFVSILFYSFNLKAIDSLYS